VAQAAQPPLEGVKPLAPCLALCSPVLQRGALADRKHRFKPPALFLALDTWRSADPEGGC